MGPMEIDGDIELRLQREASLWTSAAICGQHILLGAVMGWGLGTIIAWLVVAMGMLESGATAAGDPLCFQPYSRMCHRRCTLRLLLCTPFAQTSARIIVRASKVQKCPSLQTGFRHGSHEPRSASALRSIVNHTAASHILQGTGRPFA